MFRSDFPMIQSSCIYLDNAATTHKPRLLLEALSDLYFHHYGPVHRAIYRLARDATDAYYAARCKLQKFIHAEQPEEIIFTRGTTASLNLLARSYAQAFLHPGDVILISEIEHHANLVPWQMVCAAHGCVLRAVPVNDAGEWMMDAFLNLLDSRVKLVSLAHISNVIGTLHPVREIIAAAHQCGAHVALDGAQAVAHLAVDVQALDVDFYAFSGHKMYGPTGVGVLYGKKELLDQMPPIEGGGGMIDTASLTSCSYASLPEKFEAGTPMLAEAVGLGAVADYLREIGLNKIALWEEQLVTHALQGLASMEGVRLIGNATQRGSIISFVVDGAHPLDMATWLDNRGICVRSGHQCSQPAMQRFGVPAVIRLSFGLYNTLDEIDQCFSALRALIPILRDTTSRL